MSMLILRKLDLNYNPRMSIRFYLTILFIWTFWWSADAFNIDTLYPIRFHGQPDSYFGYSVAPLSNSKGNWVLVGAPRANSSRFSQLKEPGEIFKCKLETENCTRIHLDSDANSVEYIDRDRKYRDDKNHMWLGVSLDTTPVKEGRMVACAHLWANVIYNNYHLANGVCYTVDEEFDELTVEKLIPLIAKSDQILQSGDYKYAYAQEGTSAHFIKDSDSLLLGAPGIYDWRGSSVYMSRAESGIISKRSTSLKNYAVSVVPDPINELDFTAYFGYAVTSGRFTTTGPVLYAIGAPRQSYKGKIYIVEIKNGRYDKKVDKIGEQMGEYFGSALSAVDLNNDGLDDLLVGAPMHSKYSDEGKVYIFINKGNALLQQSTESLMGMQIAGARFGSSIAVIGDVNMDGYLDVAVGAPYENGHGAVYIYHGNSNGLKSQYQQKIESSQGSRTARGFGISIGRGMDLDGNHYPDLLVGAYASSDTFVFRTRPLVYLSGKLLPDRNQINMEVKDCDYGTNKVSCFKVEACVSFTGKFVPERLTIRYMIEVDTLKGNDSSALRVLLKTNDNKLVQNIKQEISLTVQQPQCTLYEVLATSIPTDYMTPIQVALSYEMVPVVNPQPGFCATCPLVDESERNQKIAKIRFMKHCGDDEKCDSDLQIKASILDMSPQSVLIIGTQNRLVLHTEIYNAAEPAYATMLIVDIPSWMSIDQKPPICDFTVKDPHKLICLVANPLRSNGTAIQDLNLNLEKIPVEDGWFNINVTALSDSNEDMSKLKDNNVSIEIETRAVADVYLIGSTPNEQAFYEHNEKGKILENTTANFSHVYEVFNKGPSPVHRIILKVRYPATSLDGERTLMRLMSIDTRDGPKGAVFGNCEGNIGELPESPTASGPNDGSSSLDLEKRRRREATNSLVNDSSTEWLETNNTVPIEKEAFILNCSTAICKTVSCIVGPFIQDDSATLVVVFTVNMFNLSSIMSGKDTVTISTEGQVIMSGHPSMIQPDGHRPDYFKVSTDVKPGGPPPPKQLASWIIPVSIACGILLFILLTAALVKLGFFRRKKKEEMERQMLSSPASDQNESMNS